MESVVAMAFYIEFNFDDITNVKSLHFFPSVFI